MMHKRQVLAMVRFKQREEQLLDSTKLQTFDPTQTDPEWKWRKAKNSRVGSRKRREYGNRFFLGSQADLLDQRSWIERSAQV
jgi:hypothetical protein